VSASDQWTAVSQGHESTLLNLRKLLCALPSTPPAPDPGRAPGGPLYLPPGTPANRPHVFSARSNASRVP